LIRATRLNRLSERGRLALRFFAGLCASLLLPLVLVWQMPLAPFAGLAWDWANALGYLALAIACVVFIAWHVAGSRFYLNTPVKLALAGAAASALLVYYLRTRRGSRRPVRCSSRQRTGAAYSQLLSYGPAMLLVILTLALVALRVPE